MADERTAVSEIATGLGTSGVHELDIALLTRPPQLTGVDDAVWRQVREAWDAGRHATLFEAAWNNGRAFLAAPDGLRGRPPRVVEWKGPHKPPGYESLPADLRIDHVYLVSCKYGSDISANSSPSNVFDRLLTDRAARSEDWYAAVAPRAYEEFYSEVRAAIGHDLPASAGMLTAADVAKVRATCERRWPEPLQAPWRQFSFEVAAASAARWRSRLDLPAVREQMLWRLLRLETSPYFVLGTTKGGSAIRYRVGTPWDWRQQFRLRSFEVRAVVAGQPLVSWLAVVEDRVRGLDVGVEGEIEIRWSHGRFSAVEAKLHLKTASTQVPGYFSIDGAPPC